MKTLSQLLSTAEKFMLLSIPLINSLLNEARLSLVFIREGERKGSENCDSSWPLSRLHTLSFFQWLRKGINGRDDNFLFGIFLRL